MLDCIIVSHIVGAQIFFFLNCSNAVEHTAKSCSVSSLPSIKFLSDSATFTAMIALASSLISSKSIIYAINALKTYSAEYPSNTIS